MVFPLLTLTVLGKDTLRAFSHFSRRISYISLRLSQSPPAFTVSTCILLQSALIQIPYQDGLRHPVVNQVQRRQHLRMGIQDQGEKDPSLPSLNILTRASTPAPSATCTRQLVSCTKSPPVSSAARASTPLPSPSKSRRSFQKLFSGPVRRALRRRRMCCG